MLAVGIVQHYDLQFCECVLPATSAGSRSLRLVRVYGTENGRGKEYFCYPSTRISRTQQNASGHARTIPPRR